MPTKTAVASRARDAGGEEEAAAADDDDDDDATAESAPPLPRPFFCCSTSAESSSSSLCCASVAAASAPPIPNARASNAAALRALSSAPKRPRAWTAWESASHLPRRVAATASGEEERGERPPPPGEREVTARMEMERGGATGGA